MIEGALQKVSHLSALMAEAGEQIEQLFSRHEHVYLAFSGGKESIVLAHMCEPYRDRLSLLWVNTGFMFPHMVEFVRGYGERFTLEELTSDLPAHWRAFGLPSEILTVENAMPGGCHQEPKMQAWVSCCHSLRTAPMLTFINGLSSPAGLIHGQRHEDRTPNLGLSGAPGAWRDGVDVIAPLADWATEDVMTYVREHALTLPEQYRKTSGSLECWVCPANLATEDTSYADYMAKEYPDLLAMVLPGARRIEQAVRAATDRYKDIIKRAEPKPATDDHFVPQRTDGAGDCAIASLATVLGQSYEYTAALLGFPCDVATGLPSLPAGRGINFTEMGAPLLSIGYSTTILMAKENPEAEAYGDRMRLPASEAIKGLIRGRSAVVMVRIYLPNGECELHGLAWKNGRLIDCNRGHMDLPDIDLQDVEVLGALVIAQETTAPKMEAVND
jgi:3'-phosphoadenosine 5'-phosphosulfate sulfotransferase (PAPS reductase)/FAD synthetase